MINRPLGRVFKTLAFAVVAASLLPGCSSIHEKLTHGVSQAAAQPSGQTARSANIHEPLDIDDLGGHDAVMLAAVEDFLDRTQDYSDGVPAAASASDSPTATMSSKVVPAATAQQVRSSDPIRTMLANERANKPPVVAVANTHVALPEPVADEPRLALPVLQSVRINAAIAEVASVEQPRAVSKPNEPLQIRTGETVVSVDRFVKQLESQAENADDFDSQWRLRMVQAALNHISDLPQLSSGIPEDAGRILGSLIRLIAAARTAANDPLSNGDEALQRVEDFRQVLADRADPTVAEIALCQNVVTFGVYDKIAPDSFVVGRTTQAIVYSEIRNLRSEQTPDGQYRTLLATRLEVLTEGGQSVWQQEEPEIQDLCRRRRSDFFIAQRITLPPTLGEGGHILKVFVEDKLSGKASEGSHRFTMRSPGSVVSGR